MKASTLSGRTFSHDGEQFVVLSFDAPTPAALELNRAEREIVALVLEGYSNAEIARIRGRALSTVQNQLSGLYRRLGVGSRGELIARALASRAASRSA